MKAYSDATGREYASWEELVAAESNGYVAVAIVSSSKESWPWVLGPFDTKPDAERARARLRRRFQRELQWRPDRRASFFVRPAWKETSDAR